MHDTYLNGARDGCPQDNPPHKDGSRECQPAKPTAQEIQAVEAAYQRALLQSNTPTTRTFETGATRDTDEGKLDYEGFLSPIVLKAFAEYMHTKRRMPDGTMRDSDNWQKGIPLDAYMKSMWRHFFAVWEAYRNGETTALDAETDLLALFFNVQGMLHEVLKAKAR